MRRMRERLSGRFAVLVVASLAVLPVLAACEVDDPAPADRYIAAPDPFAGMRLAGDGVRYGPEVPQVMDVWLPTAPTDGRRAALVWVHGGAWVSSSRAALWLAGGFITELARRLGAAVVSVDFRQAPGPVAAPSASTPAAPVAPAATGTRPHRLALHAPGPTPLTTMVADITAALAWLRDHAHAFGIDPGRLVLLGDSSGGHLAGLVAGAGAGFSTAGPPNAWSGAGAPGVRAVVSLAGPTDLALLATSGADVLGIPVAGFVDSVLGCQAPDDCPAALVAAADPTTWAGSSTPPTWIVVGDLDTLVPAVHGLRWHQRLVEVRGTDEVDAIDLVDSGPASGRDHGGLQYGMNLTALEAWLRARLA